LGFLFEEHYPVPTFLYNNHGDLAVSQTHTHTHKFLAITSNKFCNKQ